MENLSLSVIMPALNEEKNIVVAITNTIKAFEDFNIKGEIIVINDGSMDNTEDLVNNIIQKDVRVRMVKHEAPKGIGASFWDGVDNTNNEIVTMIPGDNENYPWETLRYCELLNHVDIVIPFVFNKEVRSFCRNGLSWLYRFIINSTFMVNFNYTNGTVLYRRSILKQIDYRNDGFFFQTDILIRTVKKGYLFAEVPFWLGVRKEGRSKAVSFPSLKQVARGYFRLVKDHYLYKKNVKNIKNLAEDSLTSKRYSAKIF